MQSCFDCSDPAMKEALYGITILRQFDGLNLECIPYETTILNFRCLLVRRELALGILALINDYFFWGDIVVPRHDYRYRAD